MTRFALSAVLTLLPAVTHAQSVQTGIYDLQSCGTMSETTISVDMAARRIEFYEAGCDLTYLGPIPDFGGAAIYDMACEGEGSGWVDRAVLMPRHDGGLILLREGFVQDFNRC